MKKLWLMVLLTGAGFGFGLFCGSRPERMRFERYIAQQCGRDVVFTVSALQSLRTNGISEATVILEGTLDSAITGLGAYTVSTPRSDWSPEIFGALRSARDYRQVWPYNTFPPVVSNKVQQVLQRVVQGPP